MTTDQTPLTELVRTIAAAVEDLSLLVEGMPSRMDAKLAEVRGEFNTMAKTISTSMEELRVEAANIRGSLASMVGAVRTELGDAQAALRTIIGDNRAALDAQVAVLSFNISAFDGRVTELATSLESVSTKAAKQIEALQGELGSVNTDLSKQLEQQHTFIQNVRTACDTVDLYAGIANLRRDVDAANERMEAAQGETKALTDLLGETATQINSRLDGAYAASASAHVEVANLTDAMEIRFVAISDRDKDFLEQLKLVTTVQNTVAEDLSRHNVAIDWIRDTVGTTRTDLGTAQAQVAELAEGLAATRTLTEMVNARINELRNEATARLNAIAEDVQTRAGTQNVKDAVQLAMREIGEVSDQFGQGLAALETTLRGFVDTRVEAASEDLRSRIAALPVPPAPIDPDQIKEQLQAWLAEQLTEHKMQMIGFDVEAGSAGKLVFTFKQGDAEIIREVPIGLGLDYKGVFSKDDDYSTGNFVTHKGSMWYARSKPTGEPGKDTAGWQLAVKCGRDGKDMKAEQ